MRRSGILVVEDEYFIADDLNRTLTGEGLAVIGPVASEAAAQATLASNQVYFAILDINLNGSTSFEIARDLRTRRIPFLFLTGYDRDILPDEFSGVPLVRKPPNLRGIVAELQRSLAGTEAV